MANEFDFPKIFSEQFKFDMGPWLTEKSEHGLRALVELRKDLIKEENKIDKDILGYIKSDLSEAMFQMTKIYSFSLGSNYEAGDENLLFDKLDDGFEELKVKYGILEKTTKQIKNEVKGNFIKKLNEYIELPQYPGRSLLQELFEQHYNLVNEQTLNGRLLMKIEQDLFRAANGEISWDDFILESKNVIRYFFKPK